MSEAGRVIAGRAKGIRLVAPGPGTRPLADRTKQAVFAALQPELDGAAVLDLCAGSGAAGIEALSRGALRAVFVDAERGAGRVIATNLERTGLAPAARVVVADAVAFLRGAAAGPHSGAAAGTPRGAAAGVPGGAAAVLFDLVIVDPPYADTGLRDRILGELAAPAAPLATGAAVIVTAHWRTPPAPSGLLRFERERRFGETSIVTFRRVDAGAPPGGPAPAVRGPAVAGGRPQAEADGELEDSGAR